MLYLKRKKSSLLQLLSLLALITPTASWSMQRLLSFLSWSSEEQPVPVRAQPLVNPIVIARRIRAGLDSTELPAPLLDIACRYYGDDYTIATIDLHNEKYAAHAKDERYPHPIHSIANVSFSSDRDDELLVSLTNSTLLCISLPDGNIRKIRPTSVPYELLYGSEPRAITYIVSQSLVNGQTCAYFVADSLINNKNSNNCYTATVLDGDRGEPCLIQNAFNNRQMLMQKWYEKDKRYSTEDWLLGRDRRRTKIKLSVNLPKIIGSDR